MEKIYYHLTVNRKPLILIAMLFIVLVSSGMTTAATKSVDELKEDFTTAQKGIIWFLKSLGVLAIGKGFATMYHNPDRGKVAVIWAVVGVVGIILSESIVSGIDSYLHE